MFNTFQYSGRLGSSPVWFLLLGVPLLFVLAVAYSYLAVYIPLAGIVTILLLGGFVFAAGLTIGWITTLGKLRNPGVSRLFGLVGGLLALYFAWAAFVHAVVNSNAKDESRSVTMAECLNPVELWDWVLVINRVGWFEFKGSTPKGVVLWLFWGTEAVVVVGGCVFLAPLALQNELFCERCGKWCPAKEKRYAPVEGELATKPLADVAVAEIVALPTQEELKVPCFRSELLGCPTCDFKGIRFARLVETIDKEGKKDLATETMPGVVQLG